MKIEKYKKVTSNKYEVTIDDEKIKLYDDVIIKFELLRKKELTEEEFEEIIENNNLLESYYKCLKYITKKLRSEKEIYKYLIKDYEPKVINETINKLKQDGYINDELYLKSYLNDQIKFGSYGPNKIKDDLIKLGFNEEEINDRVDNISNDIWYDKIAKICEKRIRSNKTYGTSRLKEKLVYEIGRMGFYKWMIEEVIHDTSFTTDLTVVKKEYNKIYNKLNKKYDGSELDYQIKMKLHQKGFTSDEIEQIKKELL